MARPRIFWRFASDGAAAVVSASSETYGEEAARLQSRHLAEKWRSGTTTAAEWLKVDLGAAWDVSAFALLDHDLDGTEVLTLEGSFADSWGAPAFSQAVTWREGVLAEFFPAEALRWWRLRIDKAAAGHQRSAGRLLLGSHLELSRGFDPGDFRLGEEDLGKRLETPGGQVYGDGGATVRTLRGRFQALTAAEAAELALLGRTYGASVPWVLAGNHDHAPAEWLLYGTGKPRPRKWSGPDAAGFLWDAELELQESR